MFPFSPVEYFKSTVATASSYFDDKAEVTPRVNLSTQLNTDSLFAFGSCIPFVSYAIGTARLFYGVCILAFGISELINKIAISKFSESTTFFEKLSVLKGGVAPVLLKGVEHVSMGMTAQMSLFGNISCIFYELVIRPNFPAALTKEVTIDPQALSSLFDRVKQHSLCVKVNGAYQEFVKLMFSNEKKA